MLKSKCPLKNCRPIRLQKIQADQLALRVQRGGPLDILGGKVFLARFFYSELCRTFYGAEFTLHAFFWICPLPQDM
jgi:hypothetical protein